MANKPKIRFKGFDDAWEQRKLSELASMHARIGWQNLRTSEFLDVGDYMLITGTDFEDGKVNYSTCHYVEKERYDQDKNIQIKNGSILITKDGTLGKVAYVEGLSMPATLNAGVFNVEIKNKNETDGRYLFQFLKAPFLMDYVAQKATGGTIKHLNQNILVDFPISSPSKEEQTKIGEYFSSIDHLITLHQRKCDQMNELKKYMLTKMFPQNGSKVPEIRFDGYTDDWEQRKFSDVAARESFVSTSASDVPSVEYEDVVAEEGRLNKDIRLKEAVKSGITFDGSQVLYGKLRPYLHNWLNPDFKGIAVGDWWVLKPINMEKNFLYRLIQTQQFDNIANQSSGSKMPRADWNLISNSQFVVPFSKEEQSKIGGYFDNIDHLITLHRRAHFHRRRRTYK